MKAIALTLLGLALGVAGCGGHYESLTNSAPMAPPPPAPPPPPPATGVSAGGVWKGIDAGGVDFILIVTETGRFRVINEFFDQGSGNLSIHNGDEVTAGFQMLTALGSTFADGATLASCTMSGALAERQSLSVTINCTTTSGTPSQSVVNLSYDVVYERESSLQTIAGNYDDAGPILTIDANGILFEQDPTSGCVSNGQVNVIDPAFNVYDIRFRFSNCSGASSFLNDTEFEGMAVLDNTVVPESLMIAVAGDVAWARVALFGISPRL